jgi:hypothetical protein
MIEAVWAFWVLGTNARPAIPALQQLLQSTNSITAQAAEWALNGVDTNAVPLMLRRPSNSLGPP